MNKTKIEYLDYSWNPLAMRCTPASEGCANCWHITMANRMAHNPLFDDSIRAAYSGDGPIVLKKDELDAPLKLRKPALIGVQFMGDLFHEDVPFDFIGRVWLMMRKTPRHTFQILTKRPHRMLEFFTTIMPGKWPIQGNNHIWLGVTAENQKRADERIPILLQTPAAVRFVSVEPMLETVKLSYWLKPSHDRLNIAGGYGGCIPEPGHPFGRCCVKDHWKPALDFVIAGCESGHKRRRVDVNAFRNLLHQCQSARVPFFLKQMEVNGKVVKMPELDGKVWNEMPEANNGR